MNVHSPAREADVAAGAGATRRRAEDRRTAILDAAERCFARDGFHRATMNDVAAEAGMSPGNLYRYFSSKHDLVLGISERDRAMLSREFVELPVAAGFFEALRELAVKHVLEQPKAKADLVLEIWTEAVRNPQLAELCAQFDDTVQGQLVRLIEAAARAGSIRPRLTPAAVAVALSLMADGVYRTRAVRGDAAAAAQLKDMFDAAAVLLGLTPAAVREADAAT